MPSFRSVSVTLKREEKTLPEQKNSKLTEWILALRSGSCLFPAALRKINAFFASKDADANLCFFFFLYVLLSWRCSFHSLS